MRIGPTRSRNDRGAVLVVAAAFCMVAALFLAFVVDIGNQRQNRRQLTTETDAVALGAAKDWAEASLASSFDGCEDASSAARLSVYNNPVKNALADPLCEFESPNPFQGFVTVLDREVADFAFGGVTGVEQGQTGASTTVAISVVKGGKLRPLALCLLDLDFASWRATGSPAEFDIFAPKFLDPLCMDDDKSPGNWSQVVLPPSKANQNDWTDDVEHGAGEDVVVNQKLDNLTGVGMNSAAQEFEALEGTVFFLPVYSHADTSGGSHVVYPVAGFLEVLLVSSDISGSTPSLRIRPLRFQDADTCCWANGFNVELAICDVGTIGGAAGSDLPSRCLRDLPDPVSTTSTTAPCSAHLQDPKSQTRGVTPVKGQVGTLDASVTFTYSLTNPLACPDELVATSKFGSATASVSASISGSTVTATFAEGLGDFHEGKVHEITLSTPAGTSLDVAGRLVAT